MSNHFIEGINIHRVFRERVLLTYREEYKELSDIWRSLDTKAQGTITMSGAFIALAFGFLRDSNFHGIQLLLLIFSLVFLILCVLFSVISLLVRSVVSPPYGSVNDRAAVDILRDVETEDTDPLCLLYDNEIHTWRDCIADTTLANQRKSQFLKISQILFTITLFMITIMTLLFITT